MSADLNLGPDIRIDRSAPGKRLRGTYLLCVGAWKPRQSGYRSLLHKYKAVRYSHWGGCGWRARRHCPPSFPTKIQRDENHLQADFEDQSLEPTRKEKMDEIHHRKFPTNPKINLGGHQNLQEKFVHLSKSIVGLIDRQGRSYKLCSGSKMVTKYFSASSVETMRTRSIKGAAS